MKRRIILLLALISLLFFVESCATARHATSVNDVLPRDSFLFIEKTVYIKICHKNMCAQKKVFWTGSGVLIKRNANGAFILTAGHICATPATIKKSISILKASLSATTTKGEKFKTDILTFKNDKKLDICLLYAPKLTNIKPVRISRFAPVVGDKIYNLAAPMGIFSPDEEDRKGILPILEGRYVGSYNKYNSLYSVPAMGGSSGSPLFNHKGELVGVIHSVYYRFNHISIAISHESLIKFINKSMATFYFYNTYGSMYRAIPWEISYSSNSVLGNLE